MTDTSDVIISGLTNAGARILSSAQMGDDIVFTKMKIGDGSITTQDTANLTDLINPIENLDIENYEILTNDDNSVALKLSSFVKQAENSYYFRELGLFAIDPQTNEEVLYAYVNKGDNPTYIPQNSTNIAVHELASIIVAVSNKLNIIVNCDNNRISVLSREIGELVYSSLPIMSANLHLLDGSTLQGGGIYQQFVNHIKKLYTANPTASYFTNEANWQSSVTAYGVCGKFVVDTVNNTVRLPKITGIIEGTIDVSALGDLVQAGLPNITGQYGDWFSNVVETSCSGAIEADMTQWQQELLLGTYNDSKAYVTSAFKFDASLANGIYGNSSTVQPQTIKAFIYIVVATSSKTDIQVDIDEIATDLNNKLETDLSNLNYNGQAILASKANVNLNNITWDAKERLCNYTMPAIAGAVDLSATSPPYVAPADGYFYCIAVTGAGAGNLYVTNATLNVSYSTLGSNYAYISALIPVAKGQTMTYSSAGDIYSLNRYFYKCIGEA